MAYTHHHADVISSKQSAQIIRNECRLACGRWGADECWVVMAGSLPCMHHADSPPGRRPWPGRKGWADARCVLARSSRDHTRSTACISKGGNMGHLGSRSCPCRGAHRTRLRLCSWQGCSACQATCMCKHHGRRELPLTFMMCVRWARLCRRLDVHKCRFAKCKCQV